MADLKMGLVGVGGRGTPHLRTILAMRGKVDLVGVCELNPERLDAAVAASGAEGFTDAVEMMDKAKPDYIATIVSQRDLPPLVQAAADRGIHVATETPIASTLPEADLLIGIAEKGDIKLENFEQCWRNPQEHLKRSLLASGVMGEMIQARYFSFVAPYHANAVFMKMVGSRVKRVTAFGQDLRGGQVAE